MKSEYCLLCSPEINDSAANLASCYGGIHLAGRMNARGYLDDLCHLPSSTKEGDSCIVKSADTRACRSHFDSFLHSSVLKIHLTKNNIDAFPQCDQRRERKRKQTRTCSINHPIPSCIMSLYPSDTMSRYTIKSEDASTAADVSDYIV